MLHEVFVDGIKFVPQATIQPVGDEVMRKALHELVSLHYFGQWHKAKGVTSQVIALLSPELAGVMAADVSAAFERTAGGPDGAGRPVQYSMNGWRGQLSDQVKELRGIAAAILADDWFDRDDLRAVVTELICMSNSVNCVSLPGNPTFSDMSDVEVAHLDEPDQEGC